MQTISAVANSFRKLCENAAPFFATTKPDFGEALMGRHYGDLRRGVPVHVLRPFLHGICLLVSVRYSSE